MSDNDRRLIEVLEIEFVETLPKTISGKIRRVELREMEQKKKLGK